MCVGVSVGVTVGVSVGVFVGVLVGVCVGVLVGVSVAESSQLMLLPESIESLPRLIALTLVLLLSFTSTYDIDRVPCGLIFQRVTVEFARRDKSCPAAPCKVRVPVIVCVNPDGKVKIRATATILLRFLKVVDPAIV